MVNHINRTATTLLEVLIVLTLIGSILGLLLPAVQQVRESARRLSCQNNLRNVAIASLALESAQRHLPGAAMNAHPQSGQYRSDSGVFVNLLPFIEQDSLYSQFNMSVPSSSIGNRSLLGRRPAVLKCPSTEDSMSLTNMAGRFSGWADNNLIGLGCDYAGNDGVVLRNGKPLFGTVRVRVGNLVQEYKMRDVVDGTSHTFLFWESRGDFLFSSGRRGSPDVSGLSYFEYMIDRSNANNLVSTTLASYKSYLLSWTGFRVGGIFEAFQSTINFSNLAGEPYSAHGEFLPCAMTDGSVRVVSAAADSNVVMALATSQNGEATAIPGD